MEMSAKSYRLWLAKQAKRRQEIIDFYDNGRAISLAAVAKKFKISRGRAWQIVRDYRL